MMLVEELLVPRHQLDISPLEFEKGDSNATCHQWKAFLEAHNQGNEIFKVGVTFPNEIRPLVGPAFWRLLLAGNFVDAMTYSICQLSKLMSYIGMTNRICVLCLFPYKKKLVTLYSHNQMIETDVWTTLATQRMRLL